MCFKTKNKKSNIKNAKFKNIKKKIKFPQKKTTPKTLLMCQTINHINNYISFVYRLLRVRILGFNIKLLPLYNVFW